MDVLMRRFLAATVFLLCGAGAQPLLSQALPNQPLPNQGQLLERVRQNLFRQYDDAILLNGYTYHVTSTNDELNNNGKSKQRRVEEFDVLNKDGLPLYKLVAKDGKPFSNKDYEPLRRGPFNRPKKGDEAIREAKAFVDDLFRVMDFRIVRRENVRNRPTIVVEFSPRKNAVPQTQAGKMVLTHSAGEAWIDEGDSVLARLRSRFMEDLTYGTRLMVKVNKGTELDREWLKFRDEIWLPARSETRFQARVFLAMGFHFLRVEEFSDYKKFSSTSTFKIEGAP